MPVQIGANIASFSDPMALMADCHRRIEMFLGTLVGLATLEGRQLTEEQSCALAAALKYFRDALPRHTADEEESLFPRLRPLPNRAIQSALVRVAQLEGDHRHAELLHAQVEHIGRAWLDAGRLSTQQVHRMRQAVETLQARYREHIQVEDGLIFPVAREALPEDAKLAIGREMAARRKTTLV